MEKTTNKVMIDVLRTAVIRDGGTLSIQCKVMSENEVRTVEIRLDKRNEMFTLDGKIITDLDFLNVLQRAFQKYINDQENNVRIEYLRLKRIVQGRNFVTLLKVKPEFYISPNRDSIYIFRLDSENNLYYPYTFTSVRDLKSVDEEFLKKEGFKPATYAEIKPELVKLRQEIMELLWPLK